MLQSRLLVLVMAGTLVSGQAVHAQSSPAATGQADISNNQFVVGPSAVLMPKGAFLLIRKGREIGAIRFTSIELTETDDPGKATYESYFQGDASGSFLTANVVKRSGEIDLKHLKGIGRASFQTGKRKVRVGNWSFACDYPGRLNMWTYYGEQRDYGYEFAPTSARELADIDVSDKRLRWFRYDADTRVSLPLSDLPK
ncbi:MAG: hypothetical protein JWQ49_150 [Edaphobacter sp.]|nr:hypothetical protein [Edaphobacter sp.]